MMSKAVSLLENAMHEQSDACRSQMQTVFVADQHIEEESRDAHRRQQQLNEQILKMCIVQHIRSSSCIATSKPQKGSQSKTMAMKETKDMRGV
jgi:hypothetical protein